MPLPIVIDCKSVFLNTPVPRLVTALGIVTDVNPALRNAESPIVVTVAGIVIDVNAVQLSNTLVPIDPKVLVAVNVTVANLEQLLNAKLPILVTLLPIVAVVISEQDLNASTPILVTELCILMLVSPAQA